jgi:hypothetical protein
MQYGLTSVINAALEQGAPIAWGARAIWDSRTPEPDILPDRQSVFTQEGVDPKVEKKQRRELGKILGARRMNKAWKQLRAECLMGFHDEDVVILDDDKVTITVNPRASHGYLYIAAVAKPGAVTV